MISIKNKEADDCRFWITDWFGKIFFEGSIRPNDNLEIDLHKLKAGIYRLIFKTEHTSFVQEVVKY